MKLSRKLLETFIDVSDLSNKEIADHFISLGFECEGIYPLMSGTKIEVGRVLSAEALKETRGLHKCMVETSKGVRQIICGAPNVMDAKYVIVAMDGAVLPNDVVIKTAKLTGYESQGMICSLSELGVTEFFIEGEDKDGIKKIENAKVGDDPIKVLGMDDVIFDFEIYSNRGDLQGAYGFAKELSAKLNRPLKPLNIEYKGVESDIVDIDIKSDKVLFYSITDIKDIKMNETPVEMKNILKISGIKPRNLIIDISNYVMLEFGSPLHFFDSKDLSSITVKDHKGKVISLFNHELMLDNDLAIMCDDKVLAVAGTIGSNQAPVTDDTKSIYIEAADFKKEAIRKTSRKLIRTEASRRYEKDLSHELMNLARKRACFLLETLGEAKVSKDYSLYEDQKQENPFIKIDEERISKKLGYSLTMDEIKDYLKRLDFNFKNNTVQAPSHRLDINEECDVIEELVRLIDIENIPATLPKTNTIGGKTRFMKKVDLLRERLLGSGFNEVITYTLRKEKYNVEVLDPISKDKVYLRETLLPSLVDMAKYNLKREVQNIKAFEISNVYHDKGDEELLLSLIVTDYMDKNYLDSRPVNFYYVKGILEDLLDYLGLSNRYTYKDCDLELLNPFQRESIIIDNSLEIGNIGMMDPRVIREAYVFEISLTKLFTKPIRPIKDKVISEYPSIEKDVTFDVTNTKVEDIIKLLKKNLSSNLKEITMFDVYQKDKIKTASFRLRFNSDKETLKDEIINDEFLKAVAIVEDKLGTTRT